MKCKVIETNHHHWHGKPAIGDVIEERIFSSKIL